jgi:hypothetical protein
LTQDALSGMQVTARSQDAGDALAAVFCQEPFVWGLPIQGSMRSMVIIIVLPLAKLVIKQVDIVGNAVFVQELIELLFIDTV